MSRRLAVLTAGIGQPSSSRLLADRLAGASVAALHDLGVQARFDVVELREYAHDITNAVLTGFPSDALRAVVDEVTSADGVIAVSAIYNASYSGLFKSFFDALEEDSLRHTPVLIGATGGSERHSLALDHALRPLFAHLRALVVPTGVYAASADWGSTGGPSGPLGGRIEQAAEELARLIVEVPVVKVEDPYANVVPFNQLLGRG
jgi:FMN reductase